ncbi:CamS family sex pheromone protein [Weissella diestrammenae]|uniref:CamS family sex pheromone protein n=1 Tax=Weissella diestrammenae TaxID=1162633 RepID=A0A7G9T4V0_9LACO|nr:CamS family sex pheromone protein [Weissella diestrammenae]MCM0582840.1 CamS family sex pheromone protein [Weissella diestrammenae]QNN75125.1 CamS family sex pheromone protein [Weissella diestrammenae]
MRYIKWIGALVVIFILGSALVFFGNFYAKNSSNVTSTKSNKTTVSNKVTTKKGVTLTGTASSDQYKSVIKDGNYLVGKARGITASMNDNQFNTESFENGLLTISKAHFSPKSYVFQEGQLLTASTATKWLARQSNTNTEGLNPEDNGKTDDGRNPIYLQTIEEQDFMTQDGDNLKLSGIVLGIAMNTVDTYQKEQYGANFTQKIDAATRIAKGKEMAAEIIKRYRKMSGVSKDTPIVIAAYAQSPDDSLTGGSFYSWAESKSGETLSGWTDLKYANIVLPMQDNTTDVKSVATNLNKDFVNFQNTIQGFFPNLSYVTAQAQYDGQNLMGLHVDITTQFYSQTEINSFANYLAQTAPNFLPTNVPVQIRISTVSGIQALLVQKANSKTYEVINLSSY